MGRAQVIGRENHLVEHIKLYCQCQLCVTRRATDICTACIPAAAVLYAAAGTFAAAVLHRLNCVLGAVFSPFLSVLRIVGCAGRGFLQSMRSKTEIGDGRTQQRVIDNTQFHAIMRKSYI